MARVDAAGLVIYRRTASGLEIVLVHPSGDYNRHKPWGIPKGLPDPGETLENAARRETFEEASITIDRPTRPLGSIDYRKSKKRVHAFAVEATADDRPAPGCWEIDQAAFFPLAEARQIMHPDQAALLDRLVELCEQS